MKRKKKPVGASAKPPKRASSNSVKEALHYAAGRSSIGSVLVASSDKGVVAILIGDDAEQLVHDLQRIFPDAYLFNGDREAKLRVQRVLDYIESPARGLDLPLDIRGTEFQNQVWRAVQSVPLGQTSSYKEIAAKIGAPKAARAVGNACAVNHLSLVIPCHRVLASDGSISEGYGRERKRILLEREAECRSK